MEIKLISYRVDNHDEGKTTRLDNMKGDTPYLLIYFSLFLLQYFLSPKGRSFSLRNNFSTCIYHNKRSLLIYD